MRNHCGIYRAAFRIICYSQRKTSTLHYIKYIFKYYMNRKDTEQKKNIGRSLYLSGMEQTEIAEQLGVSRVTV